jgi:hypothetical protein
MNGDKSYDFSKLHGKRSLASLEIAGCRDLLQVHQRVMEIVPDVLRPEILVAWSKAQQE